MDVRLIQADLKPPQGMTVVRTPATRDPWALLRTQAGKPVWLPASALRRVVRGSERVPR